MKGEQVFPFVERNDYAFDSWINDLLNLIKNRSFLPMKKDQAFLVFVDNATEFTQMYCEGCSPREVFDDFQNE